MPPIWPWEAIQLITASIVNKDLRLPVFSIPSPMGNDMPGEVSGILQRMNGITHDIDLVLFDRGFYTKELMLALSGMDMPYLIFVPKNQSVKDELGSMIHGERKIILHEFSFYRDEHFNTGLECPCFWSLSCTHPGP